MKELSALLGALLLTELIEVPLGCLFLRGRRPLVPLLLVNLLTNPLLNAALAVVSWRTAGLPAAGTIHLTSLALGEAAVLVTEALLLRPLCRLGTRRAFAVSAVLNAVSFSVGLILQIFLF